MKPRTWFSAVLAVCALVCLLSIIRQFGWIGTHTNLGWTTVRRDDLIFEVEVEGLIEADQSVRLGPPRIGSMSNYKIVEMAREGSIVKPGDTVLAFDIADLQRELTAKQSEGESLAMQVERERDNLEMQIRNDRLAIEETRARRRKTQLVLALPAEFQTSRELAKTRFDDALVEREITWLTNKLNTDQSAGEAAIQHYTDRQTRATERIQEVNRAIAAMTVLAPRAGVVVYIPGDDRQKKNVGDSCWVSDSVVEIPDLDSIHGAGEVAEANAGRIARNQPARLRIDAFTDVEFPGVVSTIHRIVTLRGGGPLKVVQVDIALQPTGPSRLHPGMRFRGWIETERRVGVLQIPEEAVIATRDGPVVYVQARGRSRRVAITVGRRSRDSIEVIAGLQEGDLVASPPPPGWL